MFLLSCHTRYRIDALMDYPMGILVQKLMLTDSKSKGFLWVFFCLVFYLVFGGVLGGFFIWFLFVCFVFVFFLVSFSHYSKAAGF